MDSSQSACVDADNSTDCLLRALLDAFNSQTDAFDWDPLNFAFTLVVGVAALFFAAITLCQAIMSGATGRRRCSKKVIGIWAKKKKTKFDISDLTRRCVGYTPVLTRRILLSKITSPKDDAAPVFSGTQDKDCPASWLQFLAFIGLDGFIWQNFQDSANMKATQADFLPSEVQAVPAFIEVGCIVALAAMAGCETLEMHSDSAYPLLAGPYVQLHFRRDPFLGMVAWFERYAFDTPAGHEKAALDLSVHSLISAILISDGDFETRLPSTGLEPSERCFNVVGQDFDARYVEWPYGINSGPKITGPGLCIDAGECTWRMPTKALCNSWNLLLNTAHRHNISWLLYADTPAGLPTMFPTRGANVAELLDIITMIGPFWSAAKLSPTRQKVRGEVPSGGSGTTRQVLEWCLHFLQDISQGLNAFRKLGMRRKMEHRMALLEQMRSVDWVIRDRGGHDWACERVELYLMTAAIRDLKPLPGILGSVSISVDLARQMHNDPDNLDLPSAQMGASSPALTTILNLIQFFNITGCRPGPTADGLEFENKYTNELDWLPLRITELLWGGGFRHDVWR